MSPRFCSVVLALLAASSACAGHKPEASSAVEAAPAGASRPAIDVEAALAREVEPATHRRVAAADGSFEASVEASSEPLVSAKEGYTQLDFQLADTPVLCFVYPDDKDLGGMVRSMGETAFADGTDHAWVDVRADHVEGKGYVLARAHFLSDTPGGKELGDLKVAAAIVGQASLMCAHDAAGLYASFERMLRVLIGSLELKVASARPEPIETTITRAQLPGRMVTLSRYYKRNEGKDKLTITYSTTLTIGEKGELVTSDEASRETFARGSLESGIYMSADGAALAYELMLKREKGVYKVEGKLQDKPFSTEFPASAGSFPDGDRKSAELCKVRRGKLQQVAIVDYDPDHDPVRPTTGIFTKNDTPEGDLRLRLEGQTEGPEVYMSLDDACETTGGAVKAGSVTVEVERIFHEKTKG